MVFYHQYAIDNINQQDVDLFRKTSRQIRWDDFTFLANSQLTKNIHWPCYCTVHVMLSLNFCACTKPGNGIVDYHFSDFCFIIVTW